MTLKGDKYETTEEVRFRLENTVVMYDDRPVYISRVNVPEAGENEVARVFFYELPLNINKDKQTRKFLSSKKFDLAPFRMGYLNHNGNAVFVSRNPIRQNRQGLSAATTVFLNIRGQKPGDAPKDPFGNLGKAEGFTFNTMIGSQGFVDMVLGKFPSFKEAGDRLGDKGVSSIAISRSFAFVIDHDFEMLVMLHKGIKCGVAMKGAKALQIPPKFQFLREEMEDHRIPIA